MIQPASSTTASNPFSAAPITNPFDINYVAPKPAVPQAAPQSDGWLSKFDPSSGTTVPTTLGKVITGITHAITEPFTDAAAIGELLYANAKNELANPAAGMQHLDNLAHGLPTEDAPAVTPDIQQRAARGKALIAGTLMAGPVGDVVAGLGARTVVGSAAFKAMPMLVGTALKMGTGAAEGGAFGATFGALKPLDDITDTRQHAIVSNTLGGLVMGTVFSGVGAAYSVLKPAASEAENAALLGGLQAATREQGASIGQAAQAAQMPPEAMTDTELSAQIAAGTTQQSVGKKGLLAETAGAIRTGLDAVKFALPGLKQFDQDTWSTALRAKSSAALGNWFGARAAQYIEFGLQPAEKSLLWRSLAASRGNQIGKTLLDMAAETESSGAATKLVNGQEYTPEALRNLVGTITIPQLSPMEEIQLATSPGIKQATARYQQDILPLITDMRVRNGLTSLAQTDLPFMALQRATPADIEAGIATIGPDAKPVTFGAGQGGFVRQTPGAKTALGQGTYIIDGQTWIQRTMAREFGIADRNEFAARVINAPWSRKIEANTRVPQMISYNDEDVPATIISLQGSPQVLNNRFNTVADTGPAMLQSIELSTDEPIPGEVVQAELGRYLVPKVVADGYNSMLEKRASPLDLAALDAVGKLADIATTARLAGPTEIVYHAWRQVNALARQAGAGDDLGVGQRLMNKFIPWFGPRIGAMRAIFDYGSPESLDIEGRIVAAGAGSNRAFGSEAAAIPMLHGGRDFLFGLPSDAAFGLDTRVRVAAVNAMERISGRQLTSPEIADYLANFGLYNKAFQSKLIRTLGQTKLNPFSATSLPMAFGEAQHFIKGSNAPASVIASMSKVAVVKMQAEGFYRGALGYAIAGMVVQKALTNSFPWENEDGHKGDIRVGYLPDGRALYTPMPPDLARGMAITGARSLIESFGPDAVPDALRQLANTGISFVAGGPPVGFATTLALGQAPYFTDAAGNQTQSLTVVPPHANTLQALKDRALTAAGEANPTLEKVFGVGPSSNLPTGVRIINAVTPGLLVGRLPMMIQGEPIAGPKRDMAAVVSDRVGRGLALYPDINDRKAFYQQEVSKEFSTTKDQAVAMHDMLLQDLQRRRGRLRNVAQANAAGQ